MVSSAQLSLPAQPDPLSSPLDFQTVMRQQRPQLKRYAERRLSAQLRVRADASDVVQETYLLAYQELAQFQGTSREQFLAWLYRIHDRNLSRHVERHVLTQKRAVNHEVRQPDIDTDQPRLGFAASVSTPSARMHRTELAQTLQTLLQELSPEHRMVLRLRVADGLSFAAISERMSRSPGAVRKLYSRARHELSERFREREQGQ